MRTTHYQILVRGGGLMPPEAFALFNIDGLALELTPDYKRGSPNDAADHSVGCPRN